MDNLAAVIESLERTCPLVPHTAAGRLYSAVRRMKMEKELAIPIRHRAASFVCAETGKAANELSEADWDDLYSWLSSRLQLRYPELHTHLFPNVLEVE